MEAVAEGPLGGVVSGGVGFKDILAMMGNVAGSLLLGAFASSEALRGYVTAALGESAAKDAEPFLGWAAPEIGAAADAASMIETTAEVASSPATMAVSVERTLDVQLTVIPDPDHDRGTMWPIGCRVVLEQNEVRWDIDDLRPSCGCPGRRSGLARRSRGLLRSPVRPPVLDTYSHHRLRRAILMTNTMGLPTPGDI